MQGTDVLLRVQRNVFLQTAQSALVQNGCYTCEAKDKKEVSSLFFYGKRPQRDFVTPVNSCATEKRSQGYYLNHLQKYIHNSVFKYFLKTNQRDHHQPSMAYLKNRSFTLKTVFLSECWQRRSSIFFTRSSTTLLTSSEKTATSRGRMMSCLSTLRILCQSSFSLGKKTKNKPQQENDD